MTQNEVKAGGGGNPGGGSALFARLGRQTRLIERTLLALVVAIAVVPSTIFFLSELGHLQARTRAQAYFCRVLVENAARHGQAGLGTVPAELRMHMGLASVGYVRLTGTDGRELALLGDPSTSWLPASARLSLPPAVAPYAELEVGVADVAIVESIARVVAIHLCVALSLGFVLYRFPIRALRTAVQDLQSSHRHIIHADRLSELGKIYAGLAHEINNPLGIILARVGLILSGARTPDWPQADIDRAELVGDLEMIERQGARIAERVRGLLAFSRSPGAVQRDRLDLNQLVGEVVALVEKAYAQHGVRIETDLQSEPQPLVLGDTGQIQQVLLNLLNNARDASPGAGLIAITTRVEGREAVVRIRDSGTGIASEDQDRLFEPFFTTKEPGRGTGLGLYVSLGIVEEHDGDLELASSDGSGSTFEIRLPLAR